MAPHYDVAIVGGGIAGATAACHLATDRSVVLLEQENELAHHTTSRSAAVYLEHDGGDIFHQLNHASHGFLADEHDELDAPLLEPMPVLNVGDDTTRNAMIREYELGRRLTPSLRFVEGSDLVDLCPVVRPDVATCGVLEPTAASLDVMALHQLYVRRAVAAGADIMRSAPVRSINAGQSGHRWILTAGQETLTAETIVNAAGAWGDDIARLAGAQPVGLQPMRRTAFTAKVDRDPSAWAFIYSPIPGLECYFKPEAGSQLLCSLADETPSEPCDARAEEIDVALAIERINTLTTLELRSVTTAWAGLRTFAPDRAPVWGWDDAVDGFYWLVGQGGWGIVSSPAAGRIVAADFEGTGLPTDLADLGMQATDISVKRLR